MLQAILHSKAGRIQLPGEKEPINWREVFNTREDLLTSVFFGRLRYLTPQTAKNVMAVLVGPEAAAQLGELTSVEMWRAVAGTDGRTYVEPDVELRFSDALVLVEVKLPKGENQNPEQWRAQVRAIVAEMELADEIPKHFHYVALGNNKVTANALTVASFGVHDVIEPSIHQLEWADIANALVQLQVEASAADCAVLEDWIAAFGLFNLAPKPFKWDALREWIRNKPLSFEPEGGRIQDTPPSPMPTEPSIKAPDWAALQTFVTNHRIRPFP